MKNPPAFQFYPADYLADMNVRLLSWASKGLYMDLICYCWREGYIPNDSSAIAMLCGCHDLAIIEPCLKLFTQHPDDPSKLVHLRLIEERQKQIANSKNKSEGGKKGAESRWNKGKSSISKANGIANGIAIANPIADPMAKNGSSSSSSSSISSSLFESSKDDSMPSSSKKSALQLRAEKLFNRRETTKLDASEQRALKNAMPIMKQTSEEDWAMLERYYASNDSFKRTSLATLLNNWNGEIEKARKFQADGGSSAQSRPMNFGTRPAVNHYLYKDEERAEIPDA